MQIPIKNTLDVVCSKIVTAEAEARKSICRTLPDADEEQITTVFQERLHEALLDASERGEIERAFESDLAKVRLFNLTEDARQIARGLIAEVSWHPRHVEAKTGGDFGLVFTRPQIERRSGTVTIKRSAVSGLLTQSKRQRFGEKIGDLTDNQLRVLAKRLDFTSVLLYKFEDCENRKLSPFRWHDCRGATIDEVTKWLFEDSFSQNQIRGTGELLRQLERGMLGTNDPKIIEDVICPASTRTLRIDIKWKNGKGPAAQALVLTKPKLEVKVPFRQ